MENNGVILSPAPIGSSPEISSTGPIAPPLYQQGPPLARKAVATSGSYNNTIEPMPLPQQTQSVATQQMTQPLSLHQKGFVAQDSAVLNSLLQANAVPLGLLGRWPATVICPACGQLSHTSIEYKVGRGTQ